MGIIKRLHCSLNGGEVIVYSLTITSYIHVYNCIYLVVIEALICGKQGSSKLLELHHNLFRNLIMLS